jgi:hypothetical protein
MADYYYLDPNKYGEVWPKLQPYLPPTDPDQAYIGGPWWDIRTGTAKIPKSVYQNLPPDLQQHFTTSTPWVPPPLPDIPPTQPYQPPTYQGYMPDVDYLRQMPWNIPAAYQTYANIATQLGGYLLQPQRNVIDQYSRAIETLARQQQEVRESPTFQDIGQQYRRDIEYLRAEPGQGEYDRAYLTTAFENVDKTYDAAKQRMLLEYARRGIEPSSGIVQSELRKLEEARAADKAKAQRDLAMWKIGEQRSRLAEARGVAGLLAQIEAAQRGEERGLATQIPGIAQMAEDWATGRALRALPILYQIPQIAQALDVYERARRAEARGIETMLDEIERQRMLDMMAILGGTMPPSGGIAAVSPYAATASQLAALLGQQAGAAWGSLGEILGSLAYNWPTQQPQPQPQPTPTTWIPPKPTKGDYTGYF